MDDKKLYLPLLKIEEIVPILNKISIFGGLSEIQLYSLFKLLEEVEYRKGEIIFEQGDKPTHIYIIRKGKVKLIAEMDKTPLEMIIFETGQCFGETSAIGIQTHTATAIATEDTKLIVLSRNTLLSIFNTDKELFSILILNIAREACRRLHKTDEILFHYFQK